LPEAQDEALDALDAVRAPDLGRRAEVGSSEEASSPGNGAGDPRDAELAELRSMVAKFKDILGPIANTA
jgi:hypothetical protein